jgi:hypothetical protein
MKTIKVTIDRFEGNLAVFRLNSQELTWPKDELPEKTHEGSVLVFSIMTDKEAEKKQNQTAKDLLNELLANDEEQEE